MVRPSTFARSFAAAILVALARSAAALPGPEINVFVSGDVSFRSDCYWFTTGRGSVLVDTPFLPEEGEELLRILAARGAPPVGAILMTGSRPEKSWGLVASREPKPRVWASRATARSVEQTFPAERERWLRAGMPLSRLPRTPVTVSSTFSGSLNLGFEGFTLRLVEIEDMGTSPSTVILIQETGEVFSGDLVWAKTHPTLDGVDLARWRQGLRSLQALRPRKIYPGHGAAGGPELVTALLRYLDALEGAVRPLVRLSKKALSPQEASAVKRAMTRAFPDWELPGALDRSIRTEFQRQRAFLADLAD